MDLCNLDLHSVEALRACAAREAALRRRVYPKRVLSGAMAPDRAAEEILHMEFIENLLAHLRDRLAGVQEFDLGL